jgi:hypothetical protein
MSSKRKRSAKSLRAARGGSRLRKTNRNPVTDLAKMNLYRSPRIGMPQEYRTTLKYHTYGIVTNAAGFVASIRFGTNAYDVDPAVGSTAMPYFLELSAIYGRFRTLRIGYKFVVQNQEAFPISILTGFSQSVIASGSLGIAYAGNPLFRMTGIGPANGMGVKTLSGSKTVCEIYGGQQPLFDDLFTGSTTSSTLATASTMWCYCGVNSTNALTALGMIVTTEVSLDVLFFRPNLLAV